MKLSILAQAYLFDKTASINGTLVQLYNLSNAFAKKGLEVHYIATTRDKEKPQLEVKDNIHFHWLHDTGSLLDWKKKMPEYRKQLENIQPDAIYVRGRNVMQYVAGKYAQKYNIPFVWGTNGDDSAEFWKNCKRLKHSKKSLLKKIVLCPFKFWEDTYINSGMKKANFIVNQNDHQQKEAKRILNKQGIVLSSYYSSTKKKINKINSVLWIGRWSAEKQPMQFLEIAHNINRDNWILTMAGDTSDLIMKERIFHKAIKYKVKTPGNIAYIDVQDFISKHKILVNTSIKEGISNTFIEAMLAGIPVLSLNSDPNNWLNEKGIGFCAHGDKESLRKKLQALMNNPQQIELMGQKAKVFAENKFASEETVDMYIKLFEGTNGLE